MRFLASIMTFALLATCLSANSANPNSANQSKFIKVFESPTCGCCDKWVEYMKSKGYKLEVHKSTDFYKIKEQHNIKPAYQSCHTGIIISANQSYALEGHIPLGALEWLLEHKPQEAIGISAPGMPQGSPGMEQGTYEEYPVILLLKGGEYELLGIYKGDKLIKPAKIKE